MAQQEISQDALVIGAAATSHVDVSQAALIICTLLSDFTIAASPSSQSIPAGSTTTYTVTVGALNGFGQTVTLSVTGLPAGVTGSFSPTTITGSGTSVLTVTTLLATSTGTSALTITGTSGRQVHSAGVSLSVTGAIPSWLRLVIGGGFQDSSGRPLAFGKLTLQLTVDVAYPAGQVCAGRKIGIPLDANGNVAGTPTTPTIFVNSALNSPNTSYRAEVYTAAGQLAFGPVQVLIPAGTGTFNLGGWIIQ
jgi:hypothetical protein